MTNTMVRRNGTAPMQRQAPAGRPAAAGGAGGTIEALLRSPQISEQIRLALPKHLDPDRLLRIALTEIRRNPKLAECSQASLLGALFQCAQLGLEIGGSLGQAYLVPYGRDVQFQLGYRGMIDLAGRSGRVDSIEARAVFEGDNFQCVFGLHSDLQHSPDWANPDRTDPSRLTFAYAVAHLKGSDRPQFVVMSRAELEAVRKRSKGGTTGPWVTDYEAMCLAKVTKRLFKWLPVSIEMARAVAADDAAEAGLRQETSIDHLLPAEAPTPAPAIAAAAAPVATLTPPQIQALSTALDRQLTAVGRAAFIADACAAFGVADLAGIPAEHHSALMAGLGNAGNRERWNRGCASGDGEPILTAEQIADLTPSEQPPAPAMQQQAAPAPQRRQQTRAAAPAAAAAPEPVPAQPEPEAEAEEPEDLALADDLQQELV